MEVRHQQAQAARRRRAQALRQVPSEVSRAEQLTNLVQQATGTCCSGLVVCASGPAALRVSDHVAQFVPILIPGDGHQPQQRQQ